MPADGSTRAAHAHGEARAFAPGRVNLIGEHTDYNGGLCLPFAIERGVSVTANRARGPEIDAHAIDLGESERFDPRRVESREPPGGGGDGWQAFVRGVVGELARARIEVPPAKIEISGGLPRGAGLGSSAALSVALCLALLELGGASERLDRLGIAHLCGRVENQWVEASTGLLDQLASLFGEAGRVLRLDMRSLDVRPIPLDLGDWRLALLDSGERREIGASGYERRQEECARACSELGVQSLHDASLEQAARLPAPLGRRVRHVLAENARVEAAVTALAAGDLESVGPLLDASHTSLRDDYEISTAAVEAAVERARAAGAAGARIHGGGFGGHVLALFPPDAAPPTGATTVTPSPGARVL